MNKQYPRLKRTVVFVGMMGSGKTTIAQSIAELFDIPFIDTDTDIENSEGKSINDIFASNGEAYFRKLETKTIRNSLQKGIKSISIGGGAYLLEANRQIIEENSVSVWLQTETSAIWNRISNHTHRPLLQTENPYATLVSLVEERTPIYRLAQIHVRSEHLDSQEYCVNKTIEALLTAPRELSLF